MPKGDKSSYSDKQKRKAAHIEEGYEDRGVSHKEAERRAWATVNKESGGGNKSGSGRGKAENHDSSRKGGRTPSQAGMALHLPPFRPTTWQLQDNGRAFPPNHLHESWHDWLYWDVELLA